MNTQETITNYHNLSSKQMTAERELIKAYKNQSLFNKESQIIQNKVLTGLLTYEEGKLLMIELNKKYPI